MVEETVNIDMGGIESLEKLKCFFKDPVWNKEILLMDGDSVIENLYIYIDMSRKNRHSFQGSYIGIILIFILLLCTWKNC